MAKTDRPIRVLETTPKPYETYAAVSLLRLLGVHPYVTVSRSGAG